MTGAAGVLAVDQGTSATKAVVVDGGGEVVGLAEVPVHPRAAAGGVTVEQDPEELWDSVVRAGRVALEEAGVPVAAVGLANQGETVLCWDRRDGTPAGPALSWQDRRAEAVCDELAPHRGWLHEATGLELDPYFAAPKMAWLRRRLQPAGTQVVTTSDTWLLWRLCGAYVTDAATASRTMLLDLATGAWSSRACELFGLDPAVLPRVVDCAGVVGETRVFGDELPVAGAIVDQQAALLAEACVRAGEAKTTYGTGAFLLCSTGERALRSDRGLASSVAWQLGGRRTHCLDGQVYSAGSTVEWLRRIGVIAGPDDLDRPPGRHDPSVRFVPALAGLAAPHWRPDARGAFTGLSLATGRADLVGAVVEGIAAAVAGLAGAAADDVGVPLEVMRVDGGLTRSEALMQAQADLLQAPVEVYPSPHATALGAGILARLGVDGGDEPPPRAWTPARVYEPVVSPEEAAERLARHDDAVAAVMPR